MRCPRCGNENSDENRFCGMCGGTLLPASQPVTSGTAHGAPLRNPGGSAQPVRDSSPTDSPHISGPSFLGLNDPAPAPSPRKRGSLNIDPHASSSSSNLNYLLDDEEEHKSGGAGKFVVILIIMAMAAGLGYFRWKHGLAPWSIAQGAKPAAAAENSGTPAPDSASTPAASSPAPAAAPAAQPAANPEASNAAPANSGGAAANPSAANSPTPDPGTTNPPTSAAPSTPAPATPDASPTTETAKSADSDSAPAVPTTKAPAATAVDVPRPTKHPKPPAATPKPPAAIRSAAPAADQVAEAQKYLYGRGVAQDCERGMHLLKPAAAQSNPKAYIEMGALYSAGLCTPHDLPTAYRWFALALRKDPDNQAVQADLQKLWGEMTQPERQLAIKLSQ